MIEETKRKLLEEELIKKYNIKSENEEVADLVRELADTIIALYSKIREKNRVIDNENLRFEASILEKKYRVLRGKLTSFGFGEAKEREDLCTM